MTCLRAAFLFGLLTACLPMGLAGGVLPPDRATPPGAPGSRVDSSAELLQVDVAVLDSRGQPVKDLAKDDFQLFEDGREQPIAASRLVDWSPAPGTAAPYSGSRRSDQCSDDARFYGLVLDDIHTQQDRSEVVRRAASRLIDRLDARSCAAVWFASGRTGDHRTPIVIRDILTAAIGRFDGLKARFGFTRYSGEWPERDTLAALRQMAAALRETPRQRHTVVLFSEGLQVDRRRLQFRELAGAGAGERPSGGGTPCELEASRLMAAVARARVSISVIDTRSPGVAWDEGAPAGGTSQVRQARDFLQTLARETGGVAAVNVADLDAAADRIAAASASYYLLAYRPPPSSADGRFHRLEVRVRRRGLEVLARKGYLADFPAGPGIR